MSNTKGPTRHSAGFPERAPNRITNLIYIPSPPSRPSPPSSVNDSRIKFQMNKSAAKKTHLEQAPPLPGDPGECGGGVSAPLGAPQGTSPVHQGVEELWWVPKAFEDPCRGNGYPERLLRPCPHTVTLTPHKPNALTGQTRGSAETRRGRSSQRGLTGGPRRRGEGSLLTQTRTWPGCNPNSASRQVLPVMVTREAQGTGRRIWVRRLGAGALAAAPAPGHASAPARKPSGAKNDTARAVGEILHKRYEETKTPSWHF